MPVEVFEVVPKGQRKSDAREHILQMTLEGRSLGPLGAVVVAWFRGRKLGMGRNDAETVAFFNIAKEASAASVVVAVAYHAAAVGDPRSDDVKVRMGLLLEVENVG
jgi:hypothetical protein